jgi:uncharacterized membrane protein YphA (DoxX/SURF4 family)
MPFYQIPALFPELFYLEMLGPFLVRVVAGGVFLALAQWHYTERGTLATTLGLRQQLSTLLLWGLIVLETLVGSMLMVGLLTQATAIGGAILAFIFTGHTPGIRALTPYTPALHATLCAICISLLVTGAGAFAVDMPL